MIIENCNLFYDKHSLQYDNILSTVITAMTTKNRIMDYRDINQTVKMGPSSYFLSQQYRSYNHNDDEDGNNHDIAAAAVDDGINVYGFDLYSRFQISVPETIALLLIGFGLTFTNSFMSKTMSQIFYHIRHITYQIGDHLLNVLKNLFDIILFIAFIILMPFTLCVCLVLWTYKRVMVNCIKHKIGKHTFRGLMEGTDNVWACEEDQSKSIITILMTIKMDAAKVAEISQLHICDGNRQAIMEELLAMFKSRMQIQMKLQEKLTYLKRAMYGYNFWCVNYDFEMDQYVRFMDLTNASTLDFPGLQHIISGMTNSDLPHANEATWEILVSPKPFYLKRNAVVVDTTCDEENAAEYPIIFRVHHSIGDGVALMDFFIKTFCDPSSVLEYEREINNLKIVYSKKALEMKKRSILNYTMAIIKMPSIILKLALRKDDNNRIHTNELSGNKLISFYAEKYENSESHRRKLIDIVKDKKNHVSQDTTFQEVILACVTVAFKEFFEFKHFKVPRNFTAVLPLRFGDSSVQKLRNRFTVALQTVPIREQQHDTIEQNIKNIQKHTKCIRRYEYQINYWIMSFLSELLPINMLHKLIYSSHSTLAISNLMGPSCNLTLLGCDIDLLTFWLPNRGRTGIGLSLFSYRNQLQMGIVGDTNRVDSEQDLNFILDIIKNYMYDMDKY